MKTILSLLLIFGFLFSMDVAFPYQHPCDDAQEFAQVDHSKFELHQVAPTMQLADDSFCHTEEPAQTVYRMPSDIETPTYIVDHNDTCPFHPNNLENAENSKQEKGSLGNKPFRGAKCTSCHAHAIHYAESIPISKENESPSIGLLDRSSAQPSLYDKEWLKRQKAKERLGRRH